MLKQTISRSLMTVAIPAMVAAGAAQAGGLSEPVAEPAPAPAPVMPAPMATGADWTGFYVGGNLGYADLESDGLPEDFSGLTYGVHAGYLYDFGRAVLGGELEYDASNIDEEDVELDSIARAKLRVGYDAGAFMPYLVGGVARATVSDTEDDGAFGGVGIDYAFSDSLRMGAEILQHEFDDFDGSGDDVSATTASARVSFRF